MDSAGQVEIDFTEPCPCESGKLYKQCCAKKHFKWMRDTEGKVYRSIPLGNEAQNFLKEAEKYFIKIFNRKPDQDGDLVFIEQYLYSENDFERETTEAMSKVGIDPALIYAYRKTGLIITKRNKDNATDSELKEWNDAIDEFDELSKHPKKESSFLKILRTLPDELDAAIIVFGHVLAQGGNHNFKPTPCASTLIDYESYATLCATRSFKTLRSIRYLLEKDIGDDALSLARNIYENYLHIIFTKNEPDKLADLVDAVVGLSGGTHEYKKSKNGKIDKKTIIEKKTQHMFEGRVSTYRVVSASKYHCDKVLFDPIYEFLSEHTHPSFNTAHILLGKKQTLDHRVNELEFEALFFSLCFSCFVLDEIRLLPSITDMAARDIKAVITRIAKKLLQLLNDQTMLEYEFFRNLAERIRMIGKGKRTKLKSPVHGGYSGG